MAVRADGVSRGWLGLVRSGERWFGRFTSHPSQRREGWGTRGFGVGQGWATRQRSGINKRGAWTRGSGGLDLSNLMAIDGTGVHRSPPFAAVLSDEAHGRDQLVDDRDI